MSKLIWWISIIIIAMLEGVQPLVLAESPLIIDGYYKAVRASTDPASIYASFFKMEASSYNACNPVPRAPTESELNGLKVKSINALQKFVIAVADDKIPTEIVDNEEGETLVPIIAPFTCKILTSPASSVYSTEMTVEGVFEKDIVLKITGMTKWYCCTTHERNANGFYQHILVNANSYNRSIQAGYLLGFANSQTKFSFFRNDEPISFDDYYGGVFDDDTKAEKTYKDCKYDGSYKEDEAE